ncbi:tRNA (adenosine(37)-N6)-threonylcarbamoyltransferase complex dimerization subunit type 1 TsaB [Desulfobaculum senezii]
MGKPQSTPTFDAPVLVLDGTEDRLHLVLAQNGLVGAAQQWTVPGRAMQFLAPAIKGLLDSASLTTADLTGIACVRGPGSFTGLRMVLATALGIARAAGVPMAGLDYLPLLAAGPAPMAEGTIVAVTHSRTRQVYVQPFAAATRTALAAPAPLSLDETLALCATFDGPLALLGSGLRRNAAFFAESPLAGAILPPRFDHPLPEVYAEAACAAEYTSAPVEPLYLRASDAEDNLRSIAERRGMDPDEAERRLDDATSSLRAPSGSEADA